MIDRINKSKEPRSKIIKMNYSEFKFDTDNHKEIDEKKEKLIQNKII